MTVVESWRAWRFITLIRDEPKNLIKFETHADTDNVTELAELHKLSGLGVRREAPKDGEA